MNRPEKMNAINQALGDALEAEIERAVADPDIRAVILTGAGRAFCVGFDLAGEDFELDAERWREDIGANMARMKLLREAPIPVIAAVNGFALAGGLEPIMCCDMAITACTPSSASPRCAMSRRRRR
jgi:enoyl-CoA hydratase